MFFYKYLVILAFYKRFFFALIILTIGPSQVILKIARKIFLNNKFPEEY